jgi:hypothetical protein
MSDRFNLAEVLQQTDGRLLLFAKALLLLMPFVVQLAKVGAPFMRRVRIRRRRRASKPRTSRVPRSDES